MPEDSPDLAWVMSCVTSVGGLSGEAEQVCIGCVASVALPAHPKHARLLPWPAVVCSLL